MGKDRGIKARTVCIQGYKIILCILACAMLLCAYSALFLIDTYNTAILFVGVFVYFMLLLAVYNVSTYVSERVLGYIAVGMLVLMAVGLLLVGLNVKSARHYDLIHLHYAAINYLQDGSFGDVAPYFSVYPFQRNLVYTLIGIYKLGGVCGIADYRTSGTVFGAICLLLSAILAYTIANLLWNRKLGICVLLAIISNPVIYLYTSYYYTDIVAMPFFVGILYLAIRAEKETGRVKLFLYFLLGFIGHTGMQIRSTVGIATIAVFLCLWIADGKKAVKPTALFVLGIAPSLLIWNMLTAKMGGTVDPESAFPITHWIMMGMNPENNGEFSGAMYSFTASLPTRSEKVSGNLTQLSREIREMGVSGLCSFLPAKLKCIWSDGTTGIRTNLLLVVRYNKLYEYTIGTKRFVTNYIAQIMRCTGLVCVVPGLTAFKRKCRTVEMAIPVSMFGYMLFYLFWEVSEKYVLMFLPVMLLISAIGVAYIHQEFFLERPFLLREKFICGTRENKTVYAVVKKSVIIVQVVTILIAVLYSKEMIGTVANRYETRLNQPTTNASSILSASEITQSFTLDQPFNRISVRFTKENGVPDGQQYLFQLQNEGRTLYEQTFLSEDVKNNSGYVIDFSFNTIFPQEMTQYKISLTAITEYENNIGVCHIKKNTRNYYDDGEFIENGIADGDMTFSIYQRFEGTLMSKTVFYALLLGSLLLELLLYCWAQWHISQK